MFLLFSLIILATAVSTQTQKHPVVKTSSGFLRGVHETSGLFDSYFAFKGIPYAESPVGKLRFKNPVPKTPWSGERDAMKHGNHCPNPGIAGIGAGGHEDCLFLNVYTPDLNGNLSVLFWIHGGAFIIGDGNSLVYGPDLLVREDVILVTINYRLSALGFLSTGDKYGQGNYGLKDIVSALKWVNENIEAFGGNSKSITIFGQSAGAVSAHLLLLSDTSRGLFQQAIIQSGTAFSPFSLQKNPKRHAEKIGKKLKLVFNSTQSLMEQLREVDYRKILEAERGIFEMEKPLGLRPFDFVPSIEPEDSDEEIFLSDDPLNLMISGNFLKVPLIIGTTSKEGILMIREHDLDPLVFERYNENVNFLVPLSFGLQENSPNSLEVAEAFKNLYFGGKNLSKELLNEWAEFHTDAQFKFPTDRTVKYFASNQSQPIYYYNFKFDGALNFIKRLLFVRDYEGACHADDIFYLFKPFFPIPVWPTDHALTVRRRLIKMWTNFAKTGNPTPTIDDNLTVKWPKFTINGGEYLEIGHDLVAQSGKEKLKLWHDFQKKFTGHM